MENLRNQIQQQFDKMCQTGKLFRSNVTGQFVWEKYLSSFKSEHNPVFRDPVSSSHNCNLCKNFIRRYGNILSINESGKLESIFSKLSYIPEEYINSVLACDKLLVNSEIKDVFFETYEELNSLPYEKCNKTQPSYKLGIDKNFKTYTRDEAEKYGVVIPDKVYTFNHISLNLPATFVDKSGKSIEQIMASYRDKYSVFKRAMEEIPLDTLILVKDLINQGSLLDGTTHLPVLEKIIDYKKQKESISYEVDEWYWSVTYAMPESVAKFKNHLIGVLCSELAEGKELNAACESWNKRVDPVNYNKAKAPITEAQKKLAEKFVIENGYLESFNRRLATLEDVKASEILHINRDNNKPKAVGIFDSIKTPSGTGRHKRSEFDKVEEVSIDKFMTDILPTCTNVEVLLENRMEGNLVNLTTAAEDSKQIFKWNNPFSYTFNGNLAGKSQIKENVKAAGGKIEGILRCSLQWNDDDTKGIVDFDLHCLESKGEEIYYSHKKSSKTNGWLDVRMN